MAAPMSQYTSLDKRQIELVETFLAAFFHENDDVVGSTKAMKYMLEKQSYRDEIAVTYCQFVKEASEEDVLEVVLRSANRNARNFDEAINYLIDIFEMTLLHHYCDSSPDFLRMWINVSRPTQS